MILMNGSTAIVLLMFEKDIAENSFEFLERDNCEFLERVIVLSLVYA